MLEEILNKGTNTFKTVIKEDNTLYFTLKEGVHSSRDLKEIKKEEYTNTITDFLEKRNVRTHVPMSAQNDFVQLAFEYSLERVLQALDIFVHEEFVLGLQVTRNYGGRVRTIIRQQLATENEPLALSS
ncbi:MAG: hypothetical protein WAW77_05160 [Caldibacillus thermoamylovorans]|uniref:Uncharacterized protein n=1 Tax=Fervidibacillus halotolerans TaxID=2980027 RepID=A0A9E8LZE2_9BACI|nr:hypothetical protein [Fervidibacillus halotolerans]WAA12628.1 hypothetical protein OE105_00295 [Fervidibacillus halotolerans]